MILVVHLVQVVQRVQLVRVVQVIQVSLLGPMDQAALFPLMFLKVLMGHLALLIQSHRQAQGFQGVLLAQMVQLIQFHRVRQ